MTPIGNPDYYANSVLETLMRYTGRNLLPAEIDYCDACYWSGVSVHTCAATIRDARWNNHALESIL